MHIVENIVVFDFFAKYLLLQEWVSSTEVVNYSAF